MLDKQSLIKEVSSEEQEKQKIEFLKRTESKLKKVKKIYGWCVT